MEYKNTETILRECIERMKEKGKVGHVSDGYHTFDELYEFRKYYNALFVNEACQSNNPFVKCHKSKKHHDGELCFGGRWFIVVMNLPTGQISNHYKLEDWDLFDCKEVEEAEEWDGHTSADVINRMNKYMKGEW